MASEIPYDGRDQDGDGRDAVDVDGDGWASTLAFGEDCDDQDASVHPGAFDRRGDGVDADCGGSDGLDGGFGATGLLVVGVAAVVALVVLGSSGWAALGRFVAVVAQARLRIASPGPRGRCGPRR